MLSRRQLILGLGSGFAASSVAFDPVYAQTVPDGRRRSPFPSWGRRPPAPPARYEAVPDNRPGFEWLEGRWVWTARQGRWVWVPGRWVRSRRVRLPGAG
ncbi:YXWGXW repeat-containing protein [Flaviflagellibacter deserti]|uniref:YXWGXW repeat-containing protein n=1 Tax=Flaviflagellibacter deserti TaxID=2267266 RepID=A0ABV9YV82_9HYPH